MTKRQTLPKAVYERISNHISRVSGVVWNVRPLPIPGAEGLLYVYAAQHPLVTRLDTLHAVRLNLTTQSSAIGRTAEEAQALAVFEALERWCCVYQGGEDFIVGSYDQLKPSALQPNATLLFSEVQFARRVEHNLCYDSPADFIPEPLPPDHEVAWCPVWSLTHQTWRYALMSSCLFGWHDEGSLFAAADSRGVAAGPSVAFCVWNGLLELIQTDAVAIWHGNFLKKPQVEISSFSDVFFDAIVSMHDQQGRDLWVLDVTADIPGVHVFAAISRDRRTGTVVKGLGTHPVAKKSLRRALMECSQMLVNVLHVDHKTDETAYPPGATSPVREPREQIHLVPADHLRVRTARDYVGGAVINNIQDLVYVLKNMEIEVLIHDVTRPEIDLCVVRVLAPGLRSWFGRYAPGRLYTVPVAMGERVYESPEAEINRSPVEDWSTRLEGTDVHAFLAKQHTKRATQGL